MGMKKAQFVIDWDKRELYMDESELESQGVTVCQYESPTARGRHWITSVVCFISDPKDKAKEREERLKEARAIAEK